MDISDREIPNFLKVLLVKVDFERLDTSLYDAFGYLKYDQIIYKREPNTPQGIAVYRVYVLSDLLSEEMENYLGYIKLFKYTPDLTRTEIQYMGGFRYRELFDKLLDSWREIYESYPAIAKSVYSRNGEAEDKKESNYKSILDQIGFTDKTGWDLNLIDLWNKGYDRSDIASRVHVSPDRVTNRISELRRIFGKDGNKVMPYNKERKKQLISRSDIT